MSAASARSFVCVCVREKERETIVDIALLREGACGGCHAFDCSLPALKQLGVKDEHVRVLDP